MTTESIIEGLKEKFGRDVTGTIRRNEKRYVVSINPGSLLNVAEYLYREAGCRFIIASALHTRRGFEIHYDFSKDETGLVLNIHVVRLELDRKGDARIVRNRFSEPS